MRLGAPGDSCGLDSRPPSIITPLTLTLPSVTLPPVLHVFLRFLGKKCNEWHLGVSRIPTECVAFPSSPLFQCANCKCSYKEMPPESTDFRLNPDKGEVASRTPFLSAFRLRHELGNCCRLTVPLVFKDRTGSKPEAPTVSLRAIQQCEFFSLHYNY